MNLSLVIEFGGGMELLFGGIKEQTIEIPNQFEEKNVTMKFLISYLATNLLEERLDLFLQHDKIKPGILVLINNTDWELEDEEDYELQDKDQITFISTLHGG